jgi:steroid 5-alpha reductase family enzyme
MIASIVVRATFLIAFVVLGIVWMSGHDDVVEVAWIASFVLAALSTAWYSLTDEARAGVSQVGDMIPWPSRNFRDYI